MPRYIDAKMSSPVMYTGEPFIKCLVIIENKEEEIKALYNPNTKWWYYRTFCPLEGVIKWRYDDGS